MHIDVLMLCINFELISINFGFLINLLKLKLSQFGQILSKMARREFFIIFSDTYTCTCPYVVYQL